VLFGPAIGANAAMWYWDQAGCNRHADKNDIRAVTKAVNGGYNGLADRRAAFRKAVDIWGSEQVSEIGAKGPATSNIGRASLAGIGSQAYEVSSLVSSGRDISDAFGVP
jgi:hypothetical protein